jgi:hypothetical protein
MMDTAKPQELLIETSVRLLLQAVSLLEGMDGATYAAVTPATAPHRVGGHIRHILEFYECFLDGLGSGRIDYDARKRDLAVETEIGAALTKARSLMLRLLREPALRSDPMLLVRMEDVPASLGEDAGFLVSSAARELQVLCSHTIHHFALIGLTLRALGVEVDPDFGMAPSTLRNLAKHAQAEVIQCVQ